MLRNRWIDEAGAGRGSGSNKQKALDEDESTASSAYEIVEEEVVETLSDYGDDYLGLGATGEVEVEIEVEQEEIVEERQHGPRLPGICEGDDEDGEEEETVVSEYDERTVYSEDGPLDQSGYMSLTEVEVEDEADLEAIYNTMLEEEEEFTVREDSEVEEVTLREDELGDLENLILSNLQITEAVPASSSTAAQRKALLRKESTRSEPDTDEENEASAEECREAIDYILRQERAVARMILTEEQAETMLHLPPKVMQIIVDHMEVCDNTDSPIDWDFLLKIVMPFCVGDDGDESNIDIEDEQAGGLFLRHST